VREEAQSGAKLPWKRWLPGFIIPYKSKNQYECKRIEAQLIDHFLWHSRGWNQMQGGTNVISSYDKWVSFDYFHMFQRPGLVQKHNRSTSYSSGMLRMLCSACVFGSAVVGV
jgi:hypothetical protein